MNISFTGIQNACGTHDKTAYGTENYADTITLQLNNDGEKDLDNFKDILKKYPSYMTSDLLEICYLVNENRKNPNNPYTDFSLNSKKIKLNDENLPIFSKISNLLNRLSKGEEKIPIDAECLETYGFDNFHEKLNLTFKDPPEEQLEKLKNLHNPINAQKIAGDIQKAITQKLSDYFISRQKTIFSGIKDIGLFSYTTPEEKVNVLHLELNDGDKEIFKPFLKQDLRINSLNALDVSISTKSDTYETMFLLDGSPIEINNKTFPVFQKLSDLMTKMAQTEEELPFNDLYLQCQSLYDISCVYALQKTSLKYFPRTPKDEKELNVEDVDIVKSDKEAKSIIGLFKENIDNQMLSFFD